jgi:hypothetical protein
MGPLAPFIEAILEADRRAPRKQRHTAHRIWQRIVAERPEHKVAEVTVRQYVRERKAELGWSTRMVCVPQSYQLGQEAQVDWYEAWAELSGEQVLLQVFSMRSMASGAAFHRAYHRATQQAFLGSSRTRLQLLSGRLCGSAVRQPKSCGEEDPPWLSAARIPRQTFFWNQGDLERKLDSYRVYYNRYRCHTGLAGITPAQRGGASARPIADLDSYRWREHCNGLFQTPAAA